jgi:KTSC domain
MSAAPTLTWEQYQKLPPDKRSRPLTPAEYAALTPAQRQAAGLEDSDEGAPADFNGPVFPNPDHIRPQLDTDPAVPVTRLPNGVSFQKNNFSGAPQMDVSNPAATDVIPAMDRTVGAKMSAQPTPQPGATVPIFAPDGTLGDIPADQLVAAVKSGAKPGVHVTAPDGSPGVIPADRMQEAVKAGAKIVPIEDQPVQHPGFWASLGSDLGGLLHASGFSPYPGMDQDAKSAAAQQAHDQDQARKQAGYSLPYRAAAPVAQAAGLNVPGMEESAKEGDVGGVLGHAAAPVVTMAAGEALAHGAPAAADVMKSAAESRAGRAIGKTAVEAATDFPVIRKLAKLKENYDATAPGAQSELDATGENEPFAGGPDEPPPQKVLDATGENKPFAGGMDEAAPAKPAAQSSPAAAASATPAAKPATAQVLEQQLNDALGGRPLKPGVSLKNQPAAQAAAAGKLPDGFTPVDSTALKGYKYDPAAQEFTAITSNGQTYTHGEVTPAQVSAFENADSKGRAWTTAIKNSSPLVRKNGVPVKPATMGAQGGDVIPKSQAGMQTETAAETPAEKPAAQSAAAPDEDLTSLLQKSLDEIRGKKTGAVKTQSLDEINPPAGGVMTTADPGELTKRWGVDSESLAEGREQTRGMSPQQTEQYIQKLTDAYKKGQPVEPVMETRDADNNIVSVDGRARAIAAQRAGVERVPIMIRRIVTPKVPTP